MFAQFDELMSAKEREEDRQKEKKKKESQKREEQRTLANLDREEATLIKRRSAVEIAKEVDCIIS